MTRCVLLVFESESSTEVRCEEMDPASFESIAAAVLSAALAAGADVSRVLRSLHVGELLPANEPLVIE